MKSTLEQALTSPMGKTNVCALFLLDLDRFKVVNASDINAFALPGGPMYVNRGMIEAAKNEGEMAGVMAHEIELDVVESDALGVRLSAQSGDDSPIHSNQPGSTPVLGRC